MRTSRFIFSGAEQEADLHRLIAPQRQPTRVRRYRLRHVFDADPGADCIAVAEHAVCTDAHFRAQIIFVGAQHAVQQQHGARMRHQRADVGHRHAVLPSTSTAFDPPNAKELLKAQRSGLPKAAPRATRFNAGSAASAAPSQRCGGSLPSWLSSCIASQHKAASIAAAAPSAWPVNGLVELTDTPAPNSASITRDSIASFWIVAVPCMLM